MNAWSADQEGDVLGAPVTGGGSAKPTTPPLKNGNDLKESGYLIAVGSRTSRLKRKYRKKIPLIIILLAFLLFIIAIIVLYFITVQKYPPRVCHTKECLRSAANLALSMDRTADPCENFYQYICGNWATDHPRPDIYRSYDWFRDKQAKVYTLIRDFLSKNTDRDPKPVRQAKDMYTACMDTETLDRLGMKPVFDILKSVGLPPYPTYINMTEDFDYNSYKFDWIDTVIKVKTTIGLDVLIGFDLYSDPDNSSTFRLVMGSPENTNPFPSTIREKKRYTGKKSITTPKTTTKETLDDMFVQHYLNDEQRDDEVMVIHRKFYGELMKLFVLEREGDANIKLIDAELDHKICESSKDYYSMYLDMDDLEPNSKSSDEEEYLKVRNYSVDEIQARTDEIVRHNNGTPTLIWKRYIEGVFNGSNVALDLANEKVLISNPDLQYLSLMAAYVALTPPVMLELFIWVKVVEVMAVHTTTELRLIVQRANEQINHDAVAFPPRSLHCSDVVNDMLGLAVAYAIADPHFLDVTKPKIIAMINELKNALAHLVGQAKWMDDDTKLATYRKIIHMKTLVGFPDWLLEEGRLEEYYYGIEVDVGKHLNNMINVIQLKIKKALNSFHDSNNYTWATDPTEVNAYHTFHENAITVPMVMLQHPFFDLGLDSLNYGSLGSVLGHEITHGFDNLGRHYDKYGNMLPWWSNETIDSFVNMTQCFVDQYSSYYIPELNEHVDGKNTLAENIADNGGVREAHDALEYHLRKHGLEAKLPGFEDMTSTQLFFLSYGNLWCSVTTRDSLEAELKDEHTPLFFRAQGALQNNADFARAFNCPPGSPMNPKKQCVIF